MFKEPIWGFNRRNEMRDIKAVLDEERLKAFAIKLIQTPSLSMEEAAVSQVVRCEMESLDYDRCSGRCPS